MTPVVVVAIDGGCAKAEGNLCQRKPERGMWISHRATYVYRPSRFLDQYFRMPLRMARLPAAVI